jgi:uncharacterized protein
MQGFITPDSITSIDFIGGLTKCRSESAGIRQGIRCTVLLLTLLTLPSAPARSGSVESRLCAIKLDQNVSATMRDGVVLRADVYRPVTKTRVPVILMRTQYGKSEAQVEPSRFRSPAWFASQCYIVVVQDVRGQYASDGDFYEYVHEAQDGYDTVEWAAHLQGAVPKVGMYGSSYVGATQWLAAVTAPPSLKTIIPSNTASDFYDGWTYEDGAFRLDFIEPWMIGTIARTAALHRKDEQLARALAEAPHQIAGLLSYRPYRNFPPLRPEQPEAAPYFFDAIKHSTRDEYWKSISIEADYSRVKVPVLAFEGWYDAFLNGGLRNFSGMIQQGGTAYAQEHQRIVIGPWDHLGWGRAESPVSPRLKAIGPVADSPVNELSLAWFDHFLKGIDNGVGTGPRVDYFVMGENEWHVADSWPPRDTRYESWFLHSGGHAAASTGDGLLDSRPASGSEPEAADHFTYEPWNPVPSVGGHSCCLWTTSSQGQFDQSAIEKRGDILVYSSKPLNESLEIAGPITVVLYASTSARDTDFTAKLVDVYPDGTAINLNNGIQTGRFRESLEKPSLFTAGTVYRYEIHVWPTANLFRTGHRIRLEISSSDYPQFAPNPNTGETFGQSVSWQSAQQTILHDAEHPSAVILPMVPLKPGFSHPPVR